MRIFFFITENKKGDANIYIPNITNIILSDYDIDQEIFCTAVFN